MGASERFAVQEIPAYAGNRKPLRHVETVIIGSGFSGLLAAIRLQKKGCEDFVLLERDLELGGTWQANSYPGAEVDIPTQSELHLVHPLSVQEILRPAKRAARLHEPHHRKVRPATARTYEPVGDQARL
jgi:phytoene dehydrogenase-like protein